MKKAIKNLLIASTFCAIAVTALIGCGDGNNSGADSTSNNSSYNNNTNSANNNSGETNTGVTEALQFDTKYILCNTVNESQSHQTYFTFSSDGTGKFRYWYEYIDSYDHKYDSISNYTVTFKYVYSKADKSQISCFYNSVKYESDDTVKAVDSTWARTLTVSENVLTIEGQNGYTEYINENFLSQIPNYGK